MSIDNQISPSEVAVIDRLLERRLELQDAYAELHEKLSAHPQALHMFFDQLLAVAVFWNPEANSEVRRKRGRLLEVNNLISAKANELASLIDERSELNSISGFSCETHCHPIYLIDAAAERNYLYRSFLKKNLRQITAGFDMKYWPSIGEILRELADDAAQAKPEPHDAVTEASATGNRSALADTFRAFFVALEEVSERNYGPIPVGFEITDRSVASLLSCALGLGVEETVDSAYVKRLRQRMREKIART